MKIKHLRNGVILISVGLVFLFNNAGWVDWDVWRTIVFWWPAYIIAIGIEVAFRNSRLKFLALLSPLIFAFFILGPAWWQWDGREQDHLVQTREWSHPLNPKTGFIHADIEFSLGEITIIESAASGLDCQMEYRQSEPLISYSDDADTLQVRIEDQNPRFVGFGFNRAGMDGPRFFGWDQKNWEVGIDPKTPLRLELESSASRNNLDLSGLVLKDLDLDLKAAKANLKIGSKSDSVRIQLHQVASKVDLWLPKDSYVIITQDTYIVSDMDSDIKVHRSKEDPQPDSSPVIYLSFFGTICKLNIKSY